MNREQARREAMAYHRPAPPTSASSVTPRRCAVTPALKGIDVAPLLTASDFHAEISRRVVSKSRARKAKRHNRFAVAILMAASVFIGAIFYAASAKADGAVDAWEAEYGPAACDFLAEHPTLTGLSGVILGAEGLGLSAAQAGEAVASSVLDLCPRFTPLLTEFIRKYGPVVA